MTLFLRRRDWGGAGVGGIKRVLHGTGSDTDSAEKKCLFHKDFTRGTQTSPDSAMQCAGRAMAPDQEPAMNTTAAMISSSDKSTRPPLGGM